MMTVWRSHIDHIDCIISLYTFLNILYIFSITHFPFYYPHRVGYLIHLGWRVNAIKGNDFTIIVG